MKKLTLLIALFFITISHNANAQTIRYVDASLASTGNGTSWLTAYKTLNEAMDEAASNSTKFEIYIAKGTYFTTSTTNRDLSFTILRGGIKLFGGYASGGGSRNTSVNATILSGEIGTSVATDNSYHVMVIAGLASSADSVVLDGLNFRNGRASTNSNFSYNGISIPRNSGGGIALSDNANPDKIIVNKCIISGNYAGNTGAGVYVESTIPVFLNCLFSGNYANYGGAAFNYAGANTKYINCTISGNFDNHDGGGMRNSSANPVITNTIIYGNNGGIANNSASPGITYSLVQDLSATTNGNLNGNTDPMFVNPVLSNQAPNTIGDYRLKSTSPCVNKGSNSAYTLAGGLINTDKDYWNSDRLWDAIIDMGANELQIPIIPSSMGIVYVKMNASGDGSSWGNATGKVADALKAASTNSTIKQIWVAGGTYLPQYRADNMNGDDPNDVNNTFLLVKDVKVYGGFAGTESLLSERDLTIAANKSVLSGNLGNAAANSDNAFHVLISVNEVGIAELNGFDIKDGNGANAGNSGIVVMGIGINDNSGGGILNVNSSPVLTNLTLINNNALIGGGIFNSNSSPKINNSIIIGNYASTAGGGIYNFNSSPFLNNLIISGNNTTYYGGGVYNNNSSTYITNVLISGNTASIQGGGIFNDNSSTVLTNSSITGNNGGAGIYNTSFSSTLILQIRNSIIYGNSDGIFNNGGNSITEIAYSLVQGLSNTDDGNLDATIINPNFVNAIGYTSAPTSLGDYRLNDNSPVINKGNNAYFAIGGIPDLSAIKTDLDGLNRFRKIIDMGAYENGAYVLPVEIVNYTAQADGNRAKLKWTTATETNNATFIISRSADGKTFTEIGNVAGAGNSNSQKDYVYYDENPLSGMNFYRLEQMDYDNRKTDLGVRSVNFGSIVNNLIKVYPNPVKTSVRIEFTANNYHQLELTDANGKLLKRVSLSTIDTEKKLDMSNLASGVYFITLVGNDKVESRKVVKE